MKHRWVYSINVRQWGAEALMDKKSSGGDPHRTLIDYSLIYMLPLSAKIPFNWRELTPVSVIALDQFVLWTNAQLPYKTVKEFADAAQTASPPLKMGGTGSRREDHVLTVFLEQQTGAKFAYLPYKSGGEAATQLVGNHTAANVNNPSENLEVWRAGQVRPLCVFDKERMQYKAKVTDTMSWNDIPTCRDQGVDVHYLMLRAMFLPGKMTPEQSAFYVDLFGKLTQTSEYKEHMEKQALKPVFLPAACLFGPGQEFLARKQASATFVTRAQLRRVTQVFVPTLLFCAVTQWLGLYVASLLPVGACMAFTARIESWKAVLSAVVFSP